MWLVSSRAVLWCIFISWKLVKLVRKWKPEIRSWRILYVVKLCVTASAMFKVSWGRQESKPCCLDIWSDKQKSQTLWGNPNNRNVSKSTSSFSKHNLSVAPVNTIYHLETISAGSLRLLSHSTAESVICTWCVFIALCCQHCSVMQSGANFHEVFRICLYTVRFRRINLVLRFSHANTF